MKIGIIGMGYVGLISSTCFADIGHTVISVDTQQDIITALQQGNITIYEKYLEEKLHINLEKKRMLFTTDITQIKDCQIILITVGTPPFPNGDADLTQVKGAIKSVMSIIAPDTLLAIRSTVPIGTMSEIRKELNIMGKEDQLLGFCPEFLREGMGIQDLLHPNLLVFASDKKDGIDILQKLYQPIIDANAEKATLIHTHSFETAELIKYTINSFLATKITFINQIAQFAQKTNASMQQIIEALGADKRINKEFLHPSPGFGGSCFPKDTLALVQRGLDYHVDLSLIREVSNANHTHKNFITTWIINSLQQQYTQNFSEQKCPLVGIWGLAFKANTDDIRESASLSIIQGLLEENCIIYAHDPKGIHNFDQTLKHRHLLYNNDALSLVKQVEVLVILTEWQEYKTYASQNIAEHFANTTVFDTRGVCNPVLFKQAGICLHTFGV